MQHVINTIMVDRDMLSYLRMYLWDGFAVHNVEDLYVNKYGEPDTVANMSNNEQFNFWMNVRDGIEPTVRNLYNLFGEFGTIDWERV
jgi:hypothetical protein